MIFSVQKLDAGLRYLASHYFKILLVDFDSDMFTPIKITEQDYNYIMEKKIVAFSKWVSDFCEKDCHPDDVAGFTNMYDCASDDVAQTFQYRRKNGNKWDNCIIDILPTDVPSRKFLFVRTI